MRRASCATRFAGQRHGVVDQRGLRACLLAGQAEIDQFLGDALADAESRLPPAWRASSGNCGDSNCSTCFWLGSAPVL